MSSMYHAQQAGIKIEETDWRLQRALMKFLESHWQEPDEGIWEVRGGRKNFTHSKMMAWLAFHRGVQLIEEAGLPADGELERWKKVRDQIHREVCERGYNPKVKAFTQYYGSDALDASLLMMPMVGFLGSTFSGYPIKYFGITLPPWGYKSDPLKDFFSAVHLGFAWVFMTLIALHTGAALKHLLINRDAVFWRMWPRIARDNERSNPDTRAMNL